MKFLLSHELKQSKIKKLIGFYLAGLILFYFMSFYFEYSQVGLSPKHLSSKILGNSTLFLSALPLEELIIHIHIKLFMYLTLSIVILAIFFRTKASEDTKSGLTQKLFILIFLDNLFLLLILSGVEIFSYLKSFSFFVLQFLIFYILLKNSNYIFSRQQK